MLPIVNRIQLLIVMVGISAISQANENDFSLDILTKPGHVALLRHAIAPGFGDPANFTIGDCSTQRNLSEVGRKQAKRIGDLFRSFGIDEARVFSSEWCRCVETANLLGLGPVTTLPIINSFFQRNEYRDQQIAALQEWLAEAEFSLPLVLVTHQVNITGLAGVYPKSGELVILDLSDEDKFSVLGTIKSE